ncbi:MAG: hypothetical protein WCR20_11575, partial [Verrucomicrobiota bacterium]
MNCTKDAVQVLQPDLWWQLIASVHEQVRCHLNARHGGSKLMRDGGDEPSLHLVRLPFSPEGVLRS